MRVLGKLMQHMRLVTRMARATQTDLVAAYDRGDLSTAEWAGMVQTCRTCAWSDSCGEWLDRTDRVVDAPGSCLNKKRFAMLKGRARQRELETP